VDSDSAWNSMCMYRMMFDRRPVLTLLTDKLHVKGYIRDKGVRTARLLAASRSPERLPLTNLSGCSFVLKASHGSGYNIFVRDFRTPAQSISGQPDSDGLHRLMGRLRGFNKRYNGDFEWAYTNKSLHSFLAEEFLPIAYHLDFKWYCYTGKCQMIQVNSPKGRDDNFYTDFYTPTWERLNVTLAPHPPNPETLPRPKLLSAMYEVAERLAEGLDFVRVDLYELQGAVFFGELTFYPHGCVKEWTPPAFDEELKAAWPVDYGPCAHGWKRSRKIRPLNLTPFRGSPV